MRLENKKRGGLLVLLSGVVGLSTLPIYGMQSDLEDRILRAMHQASTYMVETVSTNGGYARLYTADLKRRWHELEGYPSQIRVEEPGTVGMGHLFLDAYHVTGHDFYYAAAAKAADALIWGQLPCGGWNYFMDFGGERSLKQWYNTIGRHAWGFEEHYHYYGNATFDDNVTAGAAGFLLRMYVQKLDPRFKVALDRAIEFVLEAQYPLGGWPQRYPLMHDFPKDGKPDYTSFYTFNDGVISNNLGFLIDCYVTLGYAHLLDPIRRAMNFYLISQQPLPQAGWGQQYDMDLRPVSARSYEPASINTRQTFQNVCELLKFYRYTGDRRFLKGVPDAIQWLERAVVPTELNNQGKRTHFFDLEVGTNRGLWSHRSGSNVQDGRYWIDYDPNQAYAYGVNTKLDVAWLKAQYESIDSMAEEQVIAESPLLSESARPERIGRDYLFHERIGEAAAPVTASEAVRLIEALDEQCRWLSGNEWVSTAFGDFSVGEFPNTALHSDKGTGRAVMDQSETQYLSTGRYISNMKALLHFILQHKNR